MAMYMKYEGIEGPVTGKYKGWIELLSVTLTPRYSSISQDISSQRLVVVSKLIDSSSPKIFSDWLKGISRKVFIDLVEGQNAPYLSVEIKTIVEAYQSSVESNGKPIELLRFRFTKMTKTSKPTAALKIQENAKDMAMWKYLAK